MTRNITTDHHSSTLSDRTSNNNNNSSISNECYSLAVELNNIGIRLLENNSYRLAMSTFREAIHVMKLVVRIEQQQQQTTPFNNSHGNEVISFAAVLNGQVLQEAQKRLHTIDGHHHHYRQASNHHQRHQRQTSPSHHSALHQQQEQQAPLRIDHLRHIRNPSQDYKIPDLASAILIYNFGLVHQRAAAVATASQQHSSSSLPPCCTSLQLQEAALRLFKMAYSIVSERDTVDANNISDMRLILLLITLNSLTQSVMELGQNDSEAHAWMQKLMQTTHVAGRKQEEQQHAYLLAMATMAPAA